MSPPASPRKTVMLPILLLASMRLLPMVNSQNTATCASFTCPGTPSGTSSSTGEGTTSCTYSDSGTCVYNTSNGQLQSGSSTCPSFLSCATCQPGYGLDDGECDKCSASQYSPAGSATSCQECAAGLKPNTDGSDCIVEAPQNCATYANGCAAADRNGQQYSTGVLNPDGSVTCQYTSTAGQQSITGKTTHSCSYASDGQLSTSDISNTCWSYTPEVCSTCQGAYGYNDGTCNACSPGTVSPAGSSEACSACSAPYSANTAQTQCALMSSGAPARRERSKRDRARREKAKF